MKQIKEKAYHLTDDNNKYHGMIRSELASFVIEMELILRENDHKTGWDDMDCDALVHRIKDEVKELSEACYQVRCLSYNTYESKSQAECKTLEYMRRVQEMRREAIDIVNFCMFLCHNYPKTGGEDDAAGRMA